MGRNFKNYIPPTREEIITNLQEKAERDGVRKLSSNGIEKDPLCCTLWEIQQEFPDVNAAIREAGLFPAMPNREDLLRSLRLFHEEHGREPLVEDVLAGSLIYSLGAYLHEFRFWNEAKRAVGFSTHKSKRRFKNAAEREEFKRKLIAFLRNAYGATGILPSTTEHDAGNPEYKSTVFIHHLGAGSWERVAAATGLRLNAFSQRNADNYRRAHAT